MPTTSDKRVVRHTQQTEATQQATFSDYHSGMLREGMDQEGKSRTTDPLDEVSEQPTEPQPRITQQLPGEVRTTRKLPPTTTRKLETGITPVTGKQAIRIPATSKMPRVPRSPHKRSPLVLIGVLLGILIIFGFTSFFVDPLDNSAQLSSFTQTINSIFSGSNNVADLSERQASPTPTPALLTNEGYCGGYDIWGTCARATTDDGSIGTGVMQKPINGAEVSQPFANPEYQFWCSCVKPHSGIDLADAYDTPIMAADSGEVIWVGWDWSGLGNAVKISHGRYIATIYGHLAKYIVKVGQNVTKGQVIAYEGNTGASTGPHLHFMVMVNNIWVNPTLYVALP
ncbi:MAG TPA: M23 family metallopeptidase [Ktedonobacteraceae bacterium]|nr:M23 family metallopeptidase [Ktedonobacteraceae bacterium]